MMVKYIYIFFLLIITETFSQPKNIFDISRSGSIKEMKTVFKINPSIINELNENKSSTLILACYRGNTAVAKFLIENVKNINYISDMGTAIMAAVYKNQIDLVELMLKHNADVNLQDPNGTTALMLAVQTKNIEMVEFLLKNNADKSLKTKDGKTAFEYAVFAGNENIINTLNK